MRRTGLFTLAIAAVLVAGGVLWVERRARVSPPAESKRDEADTATARVSRDTNGCAVIAMSDKLRSDMGIVAKNLLRARVSPEVRGYGRVLDPAPLGALSIELASAESTREASANEFARLKSLAGQGNTSARALQAAAALARRDELAAQSARDRLISGWGRALSERQDLPALTRRLASLDAVIVRVDLPVGDALKVPEGARIEALSEGSIGAEYSGVATSVEPQMQGRGFLFLCPTNDLSLAPGQSVTAYLKVPGAPVDGVIVPREAVIRTEGGGWVYVADGAQGTRFTRTQIGLDRPMESGWFITNALTAGEAVVVNGAQQLLSTELRSAGGEE